MKKYVKTSVILTFSLFAALLLAGCSTGNTPEAAPPAPETSEEPAGGAQTADAVITGILWQWEAFQDTAGKNDIAVNNPSQYTLVFRADGTVTIQADCNSVSGAYTRDGSTLQITLGPSTMAFCGEDSLDEQFLAKLGGAGTFVMEGDKLVINLMADSGNLVFANGGPAPDSEAGGSADAAFHNIEWQWVELSGTAVNPAQTIASPEKYTITFLPDGTFNAAADCNQVSGTYTQENGGFTITPGPATMALCDDDGLGEQFINLLSGVAAGGPDGADRFALETGGGAERLTFQNGGMVQ
jgi:heat shock protein HslJ